MDAYELLVIAILLVDGANGFWLRRRDLA